jgi:hypothetical protein
LARQRQKTILSWYKAKPPLITRGFSFVLLINFLSAEKFNRVNKRLSLVIAKNDFAYQKLRVKFGLRKAQLKFQQSQLLFGIICILVNFSLL